jgi:transmembrane sensor
MEAEHQEMDTATLLRHAAGTTDASEAAAVAAWAARHPAHQRQLDCVVAAWRASLADDTPAPASGWGRIAARIAAPAPRVRPLRRGSTWLLRAAAITLLLAGATVFALYRASDSPPMVQQLASWTTAPGETRVVALPDGSQATLGPSSALHLTDGFMSGMRRVDLRGTALFSVQHDATRPFAVATGDVLTTVLGTEFVVRAYTGDESIDVAVINGRVSVAAATAAELAAGDHAQIESGVVRVGRGSAAPLLAWRERRLHFDDATLRHVARELERWYDIDVVIADPSVAERRVTMSMPAADLSEVLTLLEASLAVSIQRDGGRAIIGAGARR